MNSKVKGLCKIAISICLYLVLTLVSNLLMLNGVQIRISEFLLFLVLIDYRYIYGLSIGTAIANLFLSPLGMIDAVFGTLATLLSLILMIIIKEKRISFLWPTIINSIILGLEYLYVLEIPFWITYTEIFVSELITVLIGQKIYFIIKDNRNILDLLIINHIEK